MTEMSVYAAPDVAAVRVLWDQSGGRVDGSIDAQLSAFADALSAAHAGGDRGARVLVANWLDGPRWRPRSLSAGDAAASASLTRDDAQLVVARDHGFASWSLVTGECDPDFEAAVDAVVLGRSTELDRLLAGAPDLVRRRSAYGHRATLLHYLAANGVEIRRQVVAANAADIAARLLAAGADATATLHAYGSTHDTLALLRSSAHPRAAGVADAIERELMRH